MKKDVLVLWLLAALLLAAMIMTIVFAPTRSRHGYGSLFFPESPPAPRQPGNVS